MNTRFDINFNDNTMTLPNEVNVNMPSYIIYRDSPVGQPFDATAPLAFFPPKDSDDLFDALRAEFPHLKTHSERMREATIAFLIQERTDEQSPAAMNTPLTAETTNTSPWMASFPSMSTDSSSFSSPDMLGLATPSFSNSPQTQHCQPQMSRQPSMAGTVAPSTTTPPALENMTGVFSLSDSTQPKQRVRRKMTESEKAEYRKRRIVKACEKCSKRKRKCNHNQPEMESLSKTSKVEKSKPAAHHKKPAPIPMSLSPDPAPDSGIPADQPFIQGDDWLDFTLLEDPMPEMSFDDLLQLDLEKPLENQQYLRAPQSWAADQDFSAALWDTTAPETLFDDQSYAQGPAQQQEFFFDQIQGNGSKPGFTTGNKKYPVGVQPQQLTQGGSTGDNGMLWHDLDTQQHLLDQQPHQRSRGGANGNGMLWEGLGTDQQAIGNPMLQRTPHTHNAESGDTMLFGGYAGDNVGGSSSYSGKTAPRTELTRNIKNPSQDILHDFLDADDRSIHQSEATSKPRTDRIDQANEQNRANVRSVEGTGTKDLQQASATPHADGARFSQGDATGPRHGSLTLPSDDDSRHESGGRTIDTAAELYALRRRVPGATLLLPSHSQQTPTQRIASRTGKWSHDGTYQQLQTGDPNNTPSLTGLSAILPATGAEKPARLRAPTPTQGESTNTSHAEGAALPANAHSSRPRAHGRSPLREPALTVDSSCDAYQERLHDTDRHRDHFGRGLAAVVIVAAVCAAFFALCCTAQSNSASVSVSLSMVLLALFAPAAGEKAQCQEKKKKKKGDDWIEYPGKSDTVTRQNRKNALSAGSVTGLAAKGAAGWVMTPHSSIRWSVGFDWTALCG